ncbi:Protein FAM172A [Willisornis vidua]|uniref:Protein FAM172A n=1 Tax=Willisornis vidua TaxID=1566151 RepID=A0ABQ9DMP1_9PASS|nr:Protein FAM172A [Willisornis vidua]
MAHYIRESFDSVELEDSDDKVACLWRVSTTIYANKRKNERLLVVSTRVLFSTLPGIGFESGSTFRGRKENSEDLGCKAQQIITKYVYELLQKECHLKKVTLPVDATESEPKSFIFMSEDALINPDKLLVLIHGNGVVRAGQWARRLIINEDLDSGTQIPYIKRAIGRSRISGNIHKIEDANDGSHFDIFTNGVILKGTKEGYGVIVLNPNENYIEVEKTKAEMQLSSDCSDEPAEKRERKDKIQKETKKRRDFYEKYRNPQKEKETMQIYIREIE